jgi:hypothetical protein
MNMAQTPKPAPQTPDSSPPTEDELERTLAEANANLAAFRAHAKALAEIAAAKDSYEVQQVALEASEEVLTENQAEEEARLAALLGANAAKVDDAVAACDAELAALEASTADKRAAVKAQEDAAAAAAVVAKQASEAYDRQKGAAKQIDGWHKAADAYRLEAMKERKDNPGLAYYLVKVKFKGELAKKPDPVEADEYEAALIAAAEARIAAERGQADAEALLKGKRAAFADSEKALAALQKNLEANIRAAVSKVKPPTPEQAVPPAPPPPQQQTDPVPEPVAEEAPTE